MSKIIIFNKISELLQDINKKNELLKTSADEILKIEIDIIKSKIRELYEIIDKVESPEVDSIKAEERIVKEEVPIQIESVEEVSEEEINEEKVTELEIEEGVNENIEEQIEEQIEEPIDEQMKKDDNLQPKATGDLFSNTTFETISDKFKDIQQSLNDKISDSKDEKSIGETMQKQHINDIKSAIGINEKFLFMNELFDGVLDNYNDAIDKLNSFEKLDDALAYFMELETKYKWDDSIQSYSQLKAMIERKFN